MDLVDSDNPLKGEQFMEDEAPQELHKPLAKLAFDSVRDTIDLKNIDDLMAKHLKMPPEESRNHFLVQRLAKANTTRRQQFGLWRRHRLKSEQQIEGTGGSKNIALHNDSGTTSQQTPDSISQPTTATKIDASICLDETQSAFTSSTFTALSREDQGWEIVIPRLPEKVRGKDVECSLLHSLSRTH